MSVDLAGGRRQCDSHLPAERPPVPAFLHLWGQGATRRTHRGQQFLFYWAEFGAEEPAQTRGRNGKPKPSSLRLF